jgi:hypothetical protein
VKVSGDSMVGGFDCVDASGLGQAEFNIGMNVWERSCGVLCLVEVAFGGMWTLGMIQCRLIDKQRLHCATRRVVPSLASLPSFLDPSTHSTIRRVLQISH